MQSIDYSLELATAMLEQFDSYLLSKEIFWPLGESPSSGPPFPKLSLGQLLLTLDDLRVQAEEMAPDQVQQFHDLQGTFEQKCSEKPANIERRTGAEIKQRLNLWKAYIGDLRASSTAAESYPNDVRQRVLLNRLQAYLRAGDELKSLRAELAALDQRLRGVFRRGDFVWHSRLRALYSEGDYWYLYGSPIPASG